MLRVKIVEPTNAKVLAETCDMEISPIVGELIILDDGRRGRITHVTPDEDGGVIVRIDLDEGPHYLGQGVQATRVI